MLFRIRRIVNLGLKSLWLHLLRSILTTLGIFFGVWSVITMLAIGEGASQAAQEQIARLGSNNIIIKTVQPVESEANTAQTASIIKEYGITYLDAQRIRATIPGIKVVVPLRLKNKNVEYRNRQTSIELVGTVDWFPETSPARLVRGRFLSPEDQTRGRRVCVIEEQLANKLFIVDEPLDADIKIEDIYYRIVGIVSTVGPIDTTGSKNGEQVAKASNGGVSGRVYVPISTFEERYGNSELKRIGGDWSMEKVELQELTVQVQGLDNVIPVRDMIKVLLGERNDFVLEVPLELLNQAKATQRIFSIVLGCIAAVSLLVGGIGIMNIMLATVSERTREIGIRRALGAKKRDIIIQFLSETVMLTFLGGVIGVVLGVFTPKVVEHYANMPTKVTPFSLILAFGVSGIIGIAFGMYPANRAANLDPIESLRHE
ncbi:MAG: ABC transporter permease [Phycisphaerae bacterium]|nr:ABC transporter permease [Phycisphaerae bacterium]